MPKKNKLAKYELVRERLATGDLVEWNSNNLIGWLIRLRTGSDVNHSSLVVKFEDEHCEQRRYVLEANAGGIELHLLSNRLKSHDGKAYWHRLKNEHDHKRKKIRGWALDKIDTEYDYGSLIKQLFAKVSVNGRRYFCSEFYQAAIEFVQIIPKQKKAIQPGGFEKFGILNKKLDIL